MIVGGEMPDEHPNADSNGLVFVVQEQEHSVLQAKRTVSHVVELCGSKLEITHLDDLQVKTIVQPIMQGFDPCDNDDDKMDREVCEVGDTDQTLTTLCGHDRR